jgi:alpha-galactosidase
MEVRMMKLLSLIPLLASMAVSAEFRSGRVSLRYDDQFRASIRWLGSGDRTLLVDDAAAQPGIEVNGWTLTDFRVDPKSVSRKNITHPEFGPSLECTITGSVHEPSRNLDIERRVRVLFPEKLPDVAIFEQSYRNLGSAPVRVGRVWSQRWVLDRSVSEPEQPPSALASFQGGAYSWGKDYATIMLQPGFRQSNFQGLDDRTGPEGEGGGMPIVDIWSPVMGVALAHLETVPQWIWLPVEVRADGRTEAGIWEQPQARFKQREWLGPNEVFQTVMTAVIFHHGDYYDALHNYGELLRARGVAIPRTSPPSAYEPYWKTWGFDRNFTQTGIFAILPELKRLGIRIANLDDGWFDWYGDWQVDRSPGKFPGGDPDMKNFVRRLHEEGFKTNLWWYPIGVSPESRLAKEHPELLIEDERGNHPLDDRKTAAFCPAYPPALKNIEATLTRIVADYGYDGVYVDSTGLTAVPPCFNPAHHHASPLDSFQSLPKVFELINRTLRRLKSDPWFEVCICGIPHSPYNMPWYFIANASDPTSPAQARLRIKVEKGIRGPEFCVGDCYQVPIQEWTGSSVPESFETTFGTGAQLTTFFGKLTDQQEPAWERWFRLYRELGLSRAEYLNLYDVVFDKPEVHAVRKGDEVFYGIFADAWPNKRPIELRGLNRETTYAIYDYGRERPLGTISGARPFVSIAFKDSLLVRATPVRK